MKPKLLLHTCCGPCCAHPVLRLKEDFDVDMLFYGPNIQPKEEYIRRRDAAAKVAERENLVFKEEEYEIPVWNDRIKGLEEEKENGKRCLECYSMRLEKTAQIAVNKGYGFFATTLTVSPHKSAEVINFIGNKVARDFGVEFIDEDFKKDNGFKKTNELAKEYGLYRQNYCGCIYSRGRSLYCPKGL